MEHFYIKTNKVILFVVMTQDGNNKIFPIAFTIVEGEVGDA